MEIGKEEAEVEAGLPDAQASGVLAKTEAEPREEDMSEKKKQRKSLRIRETQMNGVDSMSTARMDDFTTAKKVERPEKPKIREKEIGFIKIEKVKATKGRNPIGKEKVANGEKCL